MIIVHLLPKPQPGAHYSSTTETGCKNDFSKIVKSLPIAVAGNTTILP
jgi:hypothetical protein